MSDPKDTKPNETRNYTLTFGSGGWQTKVAKMTDERARALFRERITTFLTLGVGLGSGVVAIGLAVYPTFLAKHDTLRDRISKLTSSLNDSARIISEIEQEVNQRQELLTRLQRDADEAKNLAALNSAQANAVVQALRGELDREGNKSMWIGVAQGLGFSILGAIFGVGAGELWRRRASRRVMVSDTPSTPPDS